MFKWFYFIHSFSLLSCVAVNLEEALGFWATIIKLQPRSKRRCGGEHSNYSAVTETDTIHNYNSKVEATEMDFYCGT